MCSKDNSSEMDKIFLHIATDIVMPLIRANDEGKPITSALIAEVQQLAKKKLAQVHYGFHPKLGGT